MKPVPTACRLAIVGVLLVGWSLPALADSPPTAAPKTGAFGSGWANAEAVTAPTGTSPLPYGTGYEQRHNPRSTATITSHTTTWPWPTPATSPGRSAAGGGRSGQGGGSGGGNGGGGRGR